MNAVFSECRQYRYTLWRNWSVGLFTRAGKPITYVNFICLNPSTADAVTDDNTIRKCVKFAKSWGFGAMCVTNLFAWRSTDPKVLKTLGDPVGSENDYYLENVARNADLVVAAWSQYGVIQNRAAKVRKNLRMPMSYLRMGKGKDGQPWHPLYLPDVTKPILWEQK
jgi:hypothetical protein